MSLINLPPELILDISDHLPVDAIVALQLTHRKFKKILPVPPRLKNTTLSDCALLAIRAYLLPTNPKPSHLRCILCKAVYPLTMFRSSSNPAFTPNSSVADAHHQTEVVELPPRMCSWHVGRLARIIHTESSGKNEWVSHMDVMCMHCGAVQRWEKCDCRCDSCSTRSVRTYTRYLNNERECRRFLFWRDGAGKANDTLRGNMLGQLMAKETCWDPGESGV
jgi:hypothetical protein